MTTRTTHPTLTVGTRTYQRRGESGCWHRQAPVGIGLGWLPVHDIATSNLLDEVERLRGLAADLLTAWDANWCDSPEVHVAITEFRRVVEA